MIKVLFTVLIYLMSSAHLLAASFDCSRAASVTEKAICSDAELSKLDETMSAVYAKVYAVNPDIKANQRDWVKSTKQCADSPNLVNCLKETYKNRLSGLNQLTNKNRGWVGFEIVDLVKTDQGQGVLVGKVSPKSPAESAGLQTGDIIYQINGNPIGDPQSVIAAFSVAAGESLALKYINKNHTNSEVTLKTVSHPGTTDGSVDDGQKQKDEGPVNENSPSSAADDQKTDDLKASETKPSDDVKEAVPQSQAPSSESTPEVKESGESGSSFWSGVLAAGLIGGIVLWVMKKKKAPSAAPASKVKSSKAKINNSITEPVNAVDPTVVDHEPAKKELEIQPVDLVEKEPIKKTPEAPVEAKKEEASPAGKVNLSMLDLAQYKKENLDEVVSKQAPSNKAPSGKLSFELVIMEQDKKVLEIPLSYETVSNIVSNTPDQKANNDLFLLAAHHPATTVRETLAYKDSLSEEVINKLAHDTSVSVLRNLVRSGGFREYATEDLLEPLISLDAEIAKNIAMNAEYFDNVSAKAIARMILENGDPAVIDSLDESYRTTGSSSPSNDIVDGEEEVFVCVKNDFREAQDSTSLVCGIFSLSVDHDGQSESYSLVFGNAGHGEQADHFFKYFDYGANIAVADSSGGGWNTAWTYSSDSESFSDEIDPPDWNDSDEAVLEKLRELSRQYLQVGDDDEGSLVVIEDSIDSLVEFSENDSLNWTAYATDGFDDEKLSNFSNIWSLRVNWG